VTAAGYLALAAFLGGYFALFAVLAYPSVLVLGASGSPRFKHGWVKLFTVAGLWVLVEFLRSNIPVMRFPWNLYAHSQWKNLVFIQSADYVGAYGVSYVLALSSACLYAFGRTAWRLARYELGFTAALKQTLIVLGVLFLAVGANIGYGIMVLEGESVTRVENAGPKLSLVQGNIPQHEKWDERVSDMIFRKYDGLTRQVFLEKPDLVIWPETAFPGYWEDEPRMAAETAALVKALGTRFLIGSPTLRKTAAGSERMNSALYFAPDGRIHGRYHKLRLVPFGEYVPFFGFLRRFFEMGRFNPGGQAVLFELPYAGGRVRFAVLICFEDIFADHCRFLVRNGARMLVNITNDAWFKRSSAPYQHAASSVFRAVENRVPVVRVANTGLTCIVRPTGEIARTASVDGQELFTTAVLTAQVAPGGSPTFYRLWGDLFLIAAGALGLVTYPFYHRKLEKPAETEASDSDE
jgi:apolipoprotein N-acyltransferase